MFFVFLSVSVKAIFLFFSLSSFISFRRDSFSSRKRAFSIFKRDSSEDESGIDESVIEKLREIVENFSDEIRRFGLFNGSWSIKIADESLPATQNMGFPTIEMFFGM